MRAYVRRNKTDSADTLAPLEASKAPDIRPVRVKSVEQQSLQALQRPRSLWMSSHTSRIDALRGFCRELGLHIRVGARTGMEAIARAVADDQSPIPTMLRPTLRQLLDCMRLRSAIPIESPLLPWEESIYDLSGRTCTCDVTAPSENDSVNHQPE